MTRNTFNFMDDNKRERGRFGDNESIRGNESVRSDLVDFTLQLRDERPLAIAVSDPTKPHAKAIWLPKSQIEYVAKGKGVVEVTMQSWLAREKGLL